MGKKNTNKKKEKRRNPKKEKHEHWKFKNGRINKKQDKKIKQNLLKSQNEETSIKKEEEEIELIENEKNLFDEKGYYISSNIKEEEKNILDWDENDEKNTLTNQKEILEKMNTINEKKLDPKIVTAYKMVGEILKNYTSGQLPKAFNILTSTENWEELINLTEPYNWSPQAMYQATIQFSSSEVIVSNTFYEKYLLPALRNDIRINKKLNIHYYNSLKRSLFKPSAFFKGIILPISQNLNFKEAAIFGSILKKCSIPVNHASAALVKLMQYCKNGKNGISAGALYFIKILLMKKYAIPNQVKENFINFFCDYENFKYDIPVMFHQCFLLFVQRYKNDLNVNEREKLKKLNKKIGHHLIAEEINKELNYNSRNLNKNMQID